MLYFKYLATNFEEPARLLTVIYNLYETIQLWITNNTEKHNKLP